MPTTAEVNIPHNLEVSSPSSIVERCTPAPSDFLKRDSLTRSAKHKKIPPDRYASNI
jgi:hypothetical protein